MGIIALFTAIFAVCGSCKQIYMPNSKEMAVNTRSWSQLFSESFSDYSGYVTNLEDAIKLIKEYEVNTTTSFTVTYQTRGFGKSPIGKISFFVFNQCKFIIGLNYFFQKGYCY